MEYKDTLNLPKTEFQMKAALAKREPELIGKWEEISLYEKITEAGKGREPYTLHDGPPYANGNIHMGHALNKILKDIVVKSRFMQGYGTDYIPGWDCHGLPIELQVEKNLGSRKDELSRLEIRKECRKYASKFVDTQREEFKRLGVFGKWDKPYLTMDYAYQASILRELGRFVKAGLLYKGKKPVHWCASCSTALAEAEVEYTDKSSPAVFVKFKVKSSSAVTEGASLVIWTTTPWTLPANLAIAVHPDIVYSELNAGGETLVIAEELVKSCMEKFGIEEYETLGSLKGSELEATVCEHPFIDRESVVYTAGFVTTEAGTGCVHIAPGHGQDDYELGRVHGLETYAPVGSDGKFTSEFPEFEGQFVFKANDGIIELLKERRALLKEERLEHSYPHCWRCKNPIIFRATAQWFVSMEEGGLRMRALEAINTVKWVPGWGKERIYGMIENRPDWCLSRQRAWGVPIPALSCRDCGESFIELSLIEALADDFESEGADVWFERELSDLGKKEIKCPGCSGTNLSKENDILDVWFDSGVSFAAVCEKNDKLKDKADLYLEGSDQHRGWFHSSLLASVATRGRAPYKAVLTHGFVVDGEGKKMSKSLGNVIAPNEVIEKYGAEVLRLWVASEDYREDIRISEEILKRLSEAYRRIRNTIRYILGNLHDFDPDRDMVDYAELGELDRLTLHRLSNLTKRVLRAYEDFEFHVIYHSVHNFCAVDLSSFYLDMLKDRLYTSRADSAERRGAQTTVYYVLDHLLRLLAPVLVFTTDEAWEYLGATKTSSVHLASMPSPRDEWVDDELEAKWKELLKVKVDCSRALEAARKAKRIGHSLDAKVLIKVPSEIKELVEAQAGQLRETLIVSSLSVVEELTGEFEKGTEVEGLKVAIEKADGEKCERCWKISGSVGDSQAHPTICQSCLNAIS